MTQASWPLWLAVSLTLLLGLLWLFNAALIHHRHQPAGDHAWYAVSVRRRAAAFRDGRRDRLRGDWRFPDSFTAFANLTLAGLPLPLVLFAIITFSSGC